jgi:hypothetical protein
LGGKLVEKVASVDDIRRFGMVEVVAKRENQIFVGIFRMNLWEKILRLVWNHESSEENFKQVASRGLVSSAKM